MNEIVIPHRLQSQSRSLYFSCEKAGIVFQNQPILPTADAVLVEALLRLPPSARKKSDFTLRLPGVDAIPAESFRKEEDGERFRVFFRFAPPPASCSAELYWRTHLLGKLDLPVQTVGDFTNELRVNLPTVFVNVGGQQIAASSVVANQCRGLTATALLRSASGLAPLIDAGLRAVFSWSRSAGEISVPVPLVASQLNAREALVSASPPKVPRRTGEWQVTWMMGETVLAAQRLRAITPKAFHDSLRLLDTRFVVESEKAGLRVHRHLPPWPEVLRAAPCFVLGSREPGIAGMATVLLITSGQNDLASEKVETLVTDGPAMICGRFHSAAELQQIETFELRCRGRLLGGLPLSPVPLATINGEGGFRPQSEFLWNSSAEDELLERMSKLMETGR